MTLEQQETFAIKGPQLEILGEAESRLPAPARRRPVAAGVLALAIVLAVFGIGGARLKGAQGAVLRQFTAADEYNHGIRSDLDAQADAAASLIRQAENVLGGDDGDVAAAQRALDAFNAAPADAPDAACAANAGLYSAVDAVYNAALPRADADTAGRIEDLYTEFVSRQATIDRAGAAYNEAARAYNQTVSGFPANAVGALWGAGEVPLFEPQRGAAHHAETHTEARHDGPMR